MPSCYMCGTTKPPIDSHGYEYWEHNYGNDGEIIHYLCHTCYSSIMYMYTRARHKRFRYLIRFCYCCGLKTSIINKSSGYMIWHRNNDEEDNALCSHCQGHLYPEKNKYYQKLIATRRIRFLGKYILLSFDIKHGECLFCNKTIISGEIKSTSIHHLFYVSCMPWACTIELCNKCYRKEEARLGTIDKNGLKLRWRKNLSNAATHINH